MTASKRFIQAYDALPPEAQQRLVRRQLVPLLDTVTRTRQRTVTASAADMHRRYTRMPALNLKAKKAEIAALVRELARDAKRALIKERSSREQLLAEAVDAIVSWLNDIWVVVFEFRTHFALAHTCLLYACNALDQIGNGCGSCKCPYAGMFIPIKIRRSTGKIVKSFTLNGAHNLESVTLWIWRELFVALLATGSKRQRSTIPDMIDDIRLLLGYRALELLLSGGASFLSDTDSTDEEHDLVSEPEYQFHIVDDDGDQNYVSDNCSSVCDQEHYPKSFYASHWSWRITNQQSRLRKIVHSTLFNAFKIAPTGQLYASMIAITDDEDELEEELHPFVMSAAGHSSENLASALRILSLNSRTDSVNQLLKEYKHLLRPQDAPSLQFAVLILSTSYRSHALSIIEQELADVVGVFRAAIRFNFCNINSEVNEAELSQILALPLASLHRRTRVERWVKGVVTPQSDNPHPMALAAFMIGLPLPPGADGNDEGDMLGYFDIDGDEPEVEELREEFRPNIKARFQGWVDTAVTIKGGPALLLKVYANVIETMPFLSDKDIVEEMSTRLSDRPSRAHVFDALHALGEFCEKQRAKVRAAKGKAVRTNKPGTSRASMPG